MAEDVLIVIDRQKAMDHPKWGPRNNPAAEANIVRLLADWRRRMAPIVHVKHDSTDPDSPFRPGQEGNDFLPLTAPRAGELVVAKKVHSAFIDTELAAGLQAMAGGGSEPRLVICGALLANSVEATVRVAANLGFEVRLPADACWSCDTRRRTGRRWPAEEVHQLTLALLDGEYAEVTTVDAVQRGRIQAASAGGRLNVDASRAWNISRQSLPSPMICPISRRAKNGSSEMVMMAHTVSLPSQVVPPM